jgi:hypothetical protein
MFCSLNRLVLASFDAGDLGDLESVALLGVEDAVVAEQESFALALLAGLIDNDAFGLLPEDD